MAVITRNTNSYYEKNTALVRKTADRDCLALMVMGFRDAQNRD